MITEPDRVRILHDDDQAPELPIVEHGGRAWVVVWPGLGAHLRSIHHISLEPGGRTVQMEHPMESVYYAMSGSVTATDNSFDRRIELPTGAMAHIGHETRYVFEAGPDGAELIGGPCPADERLYSHLQHERRPGAPQTAGGGRLAARGVRIFHRDQPTAIVPMIARDARLIVWAGVGAYTANMNYVDMQAGERNKDHVHAESEDTIYILDGKGSIEDLTNGLRLEFEAGDVVHVPVGIWHAVSGDRDDHVESVGGPCPADWNMLRIAGLMPDGPLGKEQE
ncbi:MAG: cupin domain-containing protein [bacterium]|nr:cupin domain-containing protein [bacterium]